MTFPIAKKDLVYSAVILILTIAMSASFLAYRAGAQEGNIQKSVVTDDETIGTNVAEPSNFSQLPYPNCRIQSIDTSLPSSSVYKHSPYEAYMISSQHDFDTDQNFFQDVNGDNLPDYVDVRNYLNTIGTTQTEYVYHGCVYLNTGSGWDKTYVCAASTILNNSTGALVSGNYRGDCADTSFSSSESQDE